jgi:hypothetical protein
MSNLKVDTINDASGGSNAVLYGVAAPANSMGFRNRIINGAMAVWQRGITGTSGYTSVDRWQGGSTATFNQSTDVPSGFKYSLSFSIASAAYVTAIQNIESVNCYDLSGRNVTVSFWAKNSSGTSNLAVELLYANSSDNFSGVTSIAIQDVTAGSPSSSWTQYTTTFTSLPTGVANGLQVRISRQNGASASITLLTGVQLEAGSVASPFERRDYGRELQMCQRYCVVYGGDSLYERIAMVDVVNAASTNGTIYPPVTMRVTPTLAVNSASNFAIYSRNVITTCTSVNIQFSSRQVVTVEPLVASGLTTGSSGQFITNNTTAAKLTLSAEL